MLKRPITYEDFDGETKTAEYYFNLSQSELIDLEAEYDGSFGDHLQKIVSAEDSVAILRVVKKIVLLSYGILEKTEHGMRFTKNDALREGFSQTAAYDALFTELAMNDEKAAEFINGIMPKNIVEQFDKVQAGERQVIDAASALQKPEATMPPPPPSV